MNYENIRFDLAPTGVARITLHRPDKMNSFTSAMHGELRDALAHVQHNTAVRVLVLTGAGRGFSAGQDLADDSVRFVPGEAPPDLGEVVERHYKPLLLSLSALRVPTIAAVNGIAAGAGVGLALACDMVVACESASFLLPFAKIGLIPDTGCSWLIAQRIGATRALGLALTGEKLNAQRAADWGLIWQCLPDAQWASGVDTLASQLAALPTRALVRTRQALQAGHHNTLEQQLTLEGLYMRELGRSADYVEGVAAFLEKRSPRFTGA